MAGTKITRSSSTSSEKKITISFWVKLNSAGERSCVGNTSDGSNWAMFYFNGNKQLQFAAYVGGSYVMRYTTTRVFKDTSAWYHCVATADVSLSSPEVKVYVNGEEQTDLAYNVTPSQNADIGWFRNWNFEIGVQFGSSHYLDGILADLYYVQGYIHPASTFGETDSVTGEWKPKVNPTINYGGNGGNSFHMKFENSANMDLDSGSNNLSFTTTSQLTQTQDNPSNNFCTLTDNYNQTNSQGVVLNNGSNVAYYASNSNRMAMGSMGMTSGKYYFEAKPFSTGSFTSIGIIDTTWDDINGASGYGLHDGTGASGFSFASDGSGKYNNNTQTSWGGSYAANDIVGVAVDCDNSKIYFAINGTWQESGDPTSGSTGTGSAFNLVSGATYLPAVGVKNGAQVGFNFGNGQFAGSQLISSEGTNASGNGKFEYDVPAGYTALSTKGLNK